MKKILQLGALFTLLISIAEGQTVIELDAYFRQLKSVEVKIDNRTYNFLMDTGGENTFISPMIADAIERNTYGRSTGFRMNGERVDSKVCDSITISIGGMEFFHPEVKVFDIMSILPEGFERLDGVISLKTFADKNISIDLKHHQLIVESDESFKTKKEKMELVPSRFANGLHGTGSNVFLGVNLDSHQWWFLLDSGNIADVRVSMALAEEYSIEESLDNLKIKLGHHASTHSAISDDILYDGVLNYDFMEQYIFLLSSPEQKVWVRKV